MKYILLTRNAVTAVSDEDHEFLTQWGWYAESKRGVLYAARMASRTEGKRKVIAMHRVILEHMSGQSLLGLQGDHINGNTLDNQRENLRAATHRQNKQGYRRYRKHSSRFRGVFFSKNAKKWTAQVKCSDGKTRHLGYHEQEEDAARAYNKGATEYYGEFASLNSI